MSPATPAALASIGATVGLTAVAKDADGVTIPNASVTWTTDAAGVATVTPTSGLSVTAHAVGNGTAHITAHSGTVASTPGATVTVQQQLSTVALTAPATSIYLTGTPRTVQLTAAGKDANGNAMSGLPAATFQTNNANVTVSAGGLVTAAAEGTTTITATISGKVSAPLTITVAAAPPAAQHVRVNAAGVTFSPSTPTIHVGDIIDFVFDGVGHTVTWDGNAPPSGDIGAFSTPVANATVSRTFTAAGTYNFHCQIHGGPGTGMHGTITVTP